MQKRAVGWEEEELGWDEEEVGWDEVAALLLRCGVTVCEDMDVT